MYKNNCAVVNGKRTFNMFSTQDPVEHAQVKRPIVKFYSWSSVLTMEPHIDKVIADFTQQLDTRFVSPAGGVPPKDVDLCAWITYGKQTTHQYFLSLSLSLLSLFLSLT